MGVLRPSASSQTPLAFGSSVRSPASQVPPSKDIATHQSLWLSSTPAPLVVSSSTLQGHCSVPVPRTCVSANATSTLFPRRHPAKILGSAPFSSARLSTELGQTPVIPATPSTALRHCRQGQIPSSTTSWPYPPGSSRSLVSGCMTPTSPEVRMSSAVVPVAVRMYDTGYPTGTQSSVRRPIGRSHSSLSSALCTVQKVATQSGMKVRPPPVTNPPAPLCHDSLAASSEKHMMNEARMDRQSSASSHETLLQSEQPQVWACAPRLGKNALDNFAGQHGRPVYLNGMPASPGTLDTDPRRSIFSPSSLLFLNARQRSRASSSASIPTLPPSPDDDDDPQDSCRPAAEEQEHPKTTLRMSYLAAEVERLKVHQLAVQEYKQQLHEQLSQKQEQLSKAGDSSVGLNTFFSVGDKPRSEAPPKICKGGQIMNVYDGALGPIAGTPVKNLHLSDTYDPSLVYKFRPACDNVFPLVADILPWLTSSTEADRCTSGACSARSLDDGYTNRILWRSLARPKHGEMPQTDGSLERVSISMRPA